VPRKKKLDYYQPCRLLVDLPENRLKIGARGTVLETYLRAKRWYHVEFLTNDLFRLDIRQLTEDEIEALPDDYVEPPGSRPKSRPRYKPEPAAPPRPKTRKAKATKKAKPG
jgi:hypothetical protein